MIYFRHRQTCPEIQKKTLQSTFTFWQWAIKITEEVKCLILEKSPFKKVNLLAADTCLAQRSASVIKECLRIGWCVRHLYKWHLLSGSLSDSQQQRVNLASHSYNMSLKGILTVWLSRSNRNIEHREENKNGERERRKKGVGVRIQFPLTACSGSPFQWKNISSVKLNGSVLGKAKENGIKTIH